jgi:hypothetical protein
MIVDTYLLSFGGSRLRRAGLPRLWHHAMLPWLVRCGFDGSDDLILEFQHYFHPVCSASMYAPL